MLGHYLLTLYRSLTRHRLYAALNVFGLAIGIAVFLVLWLDVRFETSFEKWIPDAGQIYVVSGRYLGPNFGGVDSSDDSMGGLLDELRGDYPQLVGTRINNDDITVLQDGRVTAEKAKEVDPSFFSVFSIPLLYSDRPAALTQPDALVLTKSKAQQLFGTADAIGRTITLVVQGKQEIHRVSGVFADPPPSSDLKFSMLIPLTPKIMAADTHWTHWGSFSVYTYLRLTPGAAATLNADLDRFTDRHGQTDMGAHPSRTLELRVHTLLSRHLQRPRDQAAVSGLLAVGVLTLLLATVNYVNLATARAGLRAREVAVRKVMGAVKGELVAQFMAEALVSTALAALIGLALCELTLPLVNAAGGTSLTLHYLGDDGVLVVLVALILIVGLAAGIYPALVLSRYQAAAVLASARTPGGGRIGSKVRAGLVALQFAIAIAFAGSTFVIMAQTRYLRSADLGFRRSGLISVTSFFDTAVTPAERLNLLAAWRALPHIAEETVSSIAPGNDDSTNRDNIHQPSQPPPGPAIDMVKTWTDFFPTLGGRLIAGRILDLQHGGDAPPASATGSFIRNVVINEKAVQVLGFSSPAAALGGRLKESFVEDQVVGVVADMRLRSPNDAIPPTIYMLSTNWEGYDNQIPTLRFEGASAQEVMASMQRVWRSIAPEVPFKARTAEDNLQTYYTSSDTNGRLFTIGAVLAVLIGCVGLYGLSSFNTARRVKEIGIRKTLGASTSDVLRLLVGQLLRPVLLANLLAWPLGWWAMRSWLNGFDQRIRLNPLYFVGASLLMLAVALVTVVGQASAVARAEPAKALRHD